MFIGEYKHTIDEKGRLAVPAKFRPALNKAAIITRGFDRCLFVFSATEWESLAKKINALSITQSNPRNFSRFIFTGAVDVEIDGQGRILIPDYLRTYAGLTKQAVIAGLYSRLEVWDEAKWVECKQKTEKDSDEIAEKLSGLGI